MMPEVADVLLYRLDITVLDLITEAELRNTIAARQLSKKMFELGEEANE